MSETTEKRLGWLKGRIRSARYVEVDTPMPGWQNYVEEMFNVIDRLRAENERLTAALRAIEKIECMEDHDEINEPCPLNIAYDALNPGPTP